MNERNVGIARGLQHDAVGLPVPQVQGLRGRRHRQADVAAGAVDARLVDARVRVRLERPRRRLVTHHRRPARPSHPREQAVVLARSEEHTSELQSLAYLVCRLLLEKKKKQYNKTTADM